jgi:hypothetical protein
MANFKDNGSHRITLAAARCARQKGRVLTCFRVFAWSLRWVDCVINHSQTVLTQPSLPTRGESRAPPCDQTRVQMCSVLRRADNPKNCRSLSSFGERWLQSEPLCTPMRPTAYDGISVD